MPKHWKKSMLRNEYRQDHRVAPRREIGRRPNQVFQQTWDALRSLRSEQRYNEDH